MLSSFITTSKNVLLKSMGECHLFLLDTFSNNCGLKYVNRVMTSRVGRHYQLTFWDALKAYPCPCKLTLLASSFGVKVFLNPKVGV